MPAASASDAGQASFKGSYVGIGEMLRSLWMLDAMVVRAERVVAEAELTAPVGIQEDPNDPSGGYRNGFRIETDPRGGVRHDRVEAMVVNDDEAAGFVEWGTTKQPGQHTMLKALDVLRGSGGGL